MRLLCYIFIISLIFNAKALALFRMLRVQCKNHNETFLRLDYCRFKLINHETSTVSLKYYLYPTLNDVTLLVKIMKRNDVGVYRTFFWDIEIDFCKFLANTKTNKMVELVFNVFKDSTNINHTCPYQGDLIVQNFTTNHRSLQYPFPNGQYMLILIWSSGKRRGIEVSTTFEYKGLRGKEFDRR